MKINFATLPQARGNIRGWFSRREMNRNKYTRAGRGVSKAKILHSGGPRKGSFQ